MTNSSGNSDTYGCLFVIIVLAALIGLIKPIGDDGNIYSSYSSPGALFGFLIPIFGVFVLALIGFILDANDKKRTLATNTNNTKPATSPENLIPPQPLS